MTRQLSVTDARNFSDCLGTCLVRKSSVGSENSPYVASPWRSVRSLCMRRHSCSIGFKCGQWAGMRCNLILGPDCASLGLHENGMGIAPRVVQIDGDHCQQRIHRFDRFGSVIVEIASTLSTSIIARVLPVSRSSAP
jgi:hypothetical protein